MAEVAAGKSSKIRTIYRRPQFQEVRAFDPLELVNIGQSCLSVHSAARSPTQGLNETAISRMVFGTPKDPKQRHTAQWHGPGRVMIEMRCTRDTRLTMAERRCFADHLAQQGLADNIWDLGIRHGLRRIHYSLVDNHTKLRLVDLREPCGLYFYSGSAMNRAVFKHTFKYSDVQALWQLENRGTLRPSSNAWEAFGWRRRW